MLEARALELINAEIDGELKPGESAELEAILESSAEARAMKAEMLKLSNILDSLPEEAPPQPLAGHILDRIPVRKRPRTFSLASLISSFQPLPSGLAFAAGLLLTVGVYEMSPEQHSPDDFTSMVGTMMMDSQPDPSAQDARLAISAPGVQGSVALSDVGDILILSFDVAAEQKTEIVIAMEDAGLGFRGIARSPSSEPEVGEYYEFTGGNLRVVSETSRPFNVYLRRVEGGAIRPQSLGIEVIQMGERVFEGSLELLGESS